MASTVEHRKRSLSARGRGRLAAGAVALAVGASGSACAPDAEAPADGEHPEEEAVLETVQDLFDAIGARDTALAAEVLHPDGQFYRVPVPSEGLPAPSPHREFVESLAEPGPDLLERMEDPEVRVHENIASAWTPYEFYAGDEFSHCGVNAFNLVRDQGRWRIAGIVYTVEPDPAACLRGLGPGG